MPEENYKERLKNGSYKVHNSRERIDITDAMQPVYIHKIIYNMYSSGYYILTTHLNPNLTLIVPHRMTTEAEYKESWQSKKNKLFLPCRIETNVGLINIPRKANYNLDVKAYCKNMCNSGCPALLQDLKTDTYSCEFKKIKKSEYNQIIEFCKSEQHNTNSYE